MDGLINKIERHLTKLGMFLFDMEGFRKWIIIGILLIIITNVACDYPCICNYHVELTVTDSPNDKGKLIGYMYEFDCKPQAFVKDLDSKWLAVAFEKKLGYVQKDEQVQIQKCPGNQPEEDKLPITTTVMMTTPTTTLILTTLTTSITSTTPSTTTTSTTPITTSTSTTPTTSITSTTPSTTTTSTAPSTITTSTTPTTSITSTSPTTTTTSTTPTTTTKSTTPTTSITSTSPTTTTTSTTQTTTTTSTTQTTSITSTTSSTTTTSTTPNTTTTSTTPTASITSTSQSNIVTSTIPTTSIKSTTPSTASTSTTPTTATSQMKTHMMVDLSAYLRKTDLCNYGSIQFGKFCYTIVPNSPRTWDLADLYCRNLSSHLLSISNALEEEYIYQVMEALNISGPLWSGLNDKTQEETFKWSSGENGSYTSFLTWKIGRKGPDNENEDCVVIEANTNKLELDDISCVSNHAFICKYQAITQTSESSTLKPRPSEATAGCNTRCEAQHGGIIKRIRNVCYERVDRSVYWSNARAACKQFCNGSLAEIHNAEEEDGVTQLMRQNPPISNSAWIGLHDLNNEGQYEWLSGASLSFKKFDDSTSYINPFHTLLNCFVITQGGFWNEAMCGPLRFPFFEEKHSFICMYDLGSIISDVLVG